MSTAAHEPRRVGPRRADSPAGSTVTPRRNAPETSDPNGLQYDSEELPVLIRLPNLSDPTSVQGLPASRDINQRPPIGGAGGGSRKTSKHDASKVSRASITHHPGHKKLVIGGIVGGVLVVTMLLLFTARSPKPPADQDGWASEAAELETFAQDQGLSITIEGEPNSLYPGFANEAPEAEAPQFASGEIESAPFGVPYFDESQTTSQSETAALPNNNKPAQSWPSEADLKPQPPSGSTSANSWPVESLSLEQGGNPYSPTDPQIQSDYRSSKYPSTTESFRMGKLDSDRPLATESDRGSILDGTIETPDTRSLR